METFAGDAARAERDLELQSGRRTHSVRDLGAPGGARGTRAFVPPRLTRHEPLTRITLVSGNDFPGSGGAGGTFFGG
jgi:hypothetical protein